MKRAGWVLFIIVLWAGCTKDDDTEKYQTKRDKIVDVRAAIKEIDIGDLMVGAIADLFPMNDYILVLDCKSYDNLIHVFDRNSLDYLCSSVKKGRGPGEIVIPGDLITDESNRRFFIPDYGKNVIYGYELDRFIEEKNYMPEVKMQMKTGLFPACSSFIGDDTLLGVVIEPVGNSSFKQAMAKWNITTGGIVPMPYEQPEIERRRIDFAASVRNDLYIEVYRHHDLMTLCSLDGTLKYNIYGPKWDSTSSNAFLYFGKPEFCRDRIVVSYCGEKNARVYPYPTKLMVFNLDGDYIKTLETGYKLGDFCYDEENNRLILALNDEIQFAWLDLDGIL